MNTIQVAILCHQANKAVCELAGDSSQKDWNDAAEWQRVSAIKGVEFTLANPDAPASANHDSWLAEKEAMGWKYGPIKDESLKEHPCFVPYEELPDDQKVKDHVFKAIVGACAPFITESAVASG